MLCIMAVMTSCKSDFKPWDKGGLETQQYRNVFKEMGYSQADIDAKLNSVFEDVFIGPNKCYFEVGDDMGYMSDIKNHDARSEGMSYGMMTAIQLDKKDIFGRLMRLFAFMHLSGNYQVIFPQN